jgi:hypothetical protein
MRKYFVLIHIVNADVIEKTEEIICSPKTPCKKFILFISVIIISISQNKTKPIIFYTSAKIKGDYYIYASNLHCNIVRIKNIKPFQIISFIDKIYNKGKYLLKFSG